MPWFFFKIITSLFPNATEWDKIDDVYLQIIGLIELLLIQIFGLETVIFTPNGMTKDKQALRDPNSPYGYFKKPNF